MLNEVKALISSYSWVDVSSLFSEDYLLVILVLVMNITEQSNQTATSNYYWPYTTFEFKLIKQKSKGYCLNCLYDSLHTANIFPHFTTCKLVIPITHSSIFLAGNGSTLSLMLFPIYINTVLKFVLKSVWSNCKRVFLPRSVFQRKKPQDNKMKTVV